MNYSDCAYFRAEDTGNNNDVYDHPSYKYYCDKKKTEIRVPCITCKKCSIKAETK